jgi:sodium transport system permease protein
MNPAWIVYLKECRESLRDRRVLANSLLLGPLLGPVLFMVLMRLVVGHELERAEQPLAVVVVGGERAPGLMEALAQMGVDRRPSVPDIERAVREQRVDLALRIPAGYADDWRAGRPAQVELIYDSSRRDSGADVDRLRGMLEDYGRRTGALRLLARGLAPSIAHGVLVANRDLATPQARGALILSMLPYMLVLTMFIGGIWLAIDATAGERERQSLEPLLTNPVPRDRILMGKWLATSTFSAASLVLGLLAFMVAAKFMPVGELGMSVELGPAFLAAVLPLLAPLVLLICGAQVLVAAFARSVREAQTYLGIAQLVPLIPSVILSVLPLKAQLWMYAVPLLGQQLAVVRLLRGEPLAASAMALSAIATLLAALAVFALARRVFAAERVAFSG